MGRGQVGVWVGMHLNVIRACGQPSWVPRLSRMRDEKKILLHQPTNQHNTNQHNTLSHSHTLTSHTLHPL